MIHFVGNETTLLNDPLFSKEALSGYVDKREVPVKQKQHKTYVITTNENTSKSLNSFLLCHWDHYFDKCEDFMEKAIEDKSKFLAKCKLDYECYVLIPSDDNARRCKPRRVCTTCK